MTATTSPAAPIPFQPHALRGRANAAFFSLFDRYIERRLHQRKASVLADLPRAVVEIGPGTGANVRYLPPVATLVAIEPNPHMHTALRRTAREHDVRLVLHQRSAEATGLPDDSADCVVSSLVLCSVGDPAGVLAEVRRILRPGGTFRFLEHVAAPEGTATRAIQRGLRRPWGYAFEGCSCERDLEAVIRGAGFSGVSLDRYRLRSPFVPFNTQIAGIATK